MWMNLQNEETKIEDKLQLVTKYLTKSKKIRQNLIRRENYGICFYVIFGRYCQISVSGGETGH